MKMLYPVDRQVGAETKETALLETGHDQPALGREVGLDPSPERGRLD
jgi:hypothetical protein